MYLSMEYIRFALYNQRYTVYNSGMVIHDMPRIKQIYIYVVIFEIFMYAHI